VEPIVATAMLDDVHVALVSTLMVPSLYVPVAVYC